MKLILCSVLLGLGILLGTVLWGWICFVVGLLRLDS